MTRMVDGVHNCIRFRCCGRPIFLRASKKIDDEPHCPECFYKKKDAKANQAINNNPDVCSSCGTESLHKDLALIEGFSICKPCLSSGPDLALDLARKRRKKSLEEMNKKLEG